RQFYQALHANIRAVRCWKALSTWAPSGMFFGEPPAPPPRVRPDVDLREVRSARMDMVAQPPSMRAPLSSSVEGPIAAAPPRWTAPPRWYCSSSVRVAGALPLCPGQKTSDDLLSVLATLGHLILRSPRGESDRALRKVAPSDLRPVAGGAVAGPCPPPGRPRARSPAGAGVPAPGSSRAGTGRAPIPAAAGPAAPAAGAGRPTGARCPGPPRRRRPSGAGSPGWPAIPSPGSSLGSAPASASAALDAAAAGLLPPPSGPAPRSTPSAPPRGSA